MMSRTNVRSSVVVMVAAVLVMGVQLNLHDDGCHAFAPPSSTWTSTSPSSSTSLHIIGPMIRRMRENADKKNMPMAAPDEVRDEAPGLRVGATAWKWPPVWPYDSNFFKRKAELDADAESKKNGAGAGGLMGMGGGMGAMMGGGNSGDSAKVGERAAEGAGDDGGESTTAFDSLKYWHEKQDVKTDLDERVAERITK
jgi:hypothetical protein